ncbi:hypothetical protein HMPREF9306_00985 [Propionimicrobium lymphophilum ACS-093-V-SCH5]|uniref:FAD-binding PCMH-type domain-containing protein n=2 Tax=Propionibacteriaceae TaxID=31957 RepID=S2W599_9ACTN|nr:hypothetical protein HMPREF9306_00985 [Propionimicrobium lymphophilum ACS-093-V-SCH5]
MLSKRPIFRIDVWLVSSTSGHSATFGSLSGRLEAMFATKKAPSQPLLGNFTCLDESSLTKAIYSSDSSIYRVVPKVVATPKTRSELIDLVRAALKEKLPITARGAGTSCAGNAVGSGLVIDMRKHLNKIIEINPQEQTATIEPGVVQSALQEAAKPYGLRFGPDPSTANRCTIGGMIGNNACGPRALGYGRTSDNVVELEVLTGTGELITLTRDGIKGMSDKPLRNFANSNLGTIRTEFGAFSRQVSGYSLEHLLPENGFNIAGFFAGTEGTLGVVTKAKVRLVKDAPLKTTIALGYPTMPQAADDMPILLKYSPTACEGMDRRLSNLVAERIGPHAVPELPSGDAWIFIELVGDDAEEISARAHSMVEDSNCTEGWVVADPSAAARLWGIRSDAAGLAGVALDRPAYAGWEDSAVPPAKLGDYLRDFEKLLAKFDLRGLPYGHFGDGCVHCRIDFPLEDADGPQRYKNFVMAAAELVAGYGGSVSGEHGDGRARSELLAKTYSSKAIELFGQIKNFFDPKNLLNPGILVNPVSVSDDIRAFQSRKSALKVKHPQFAANVHRCTGVGKCLANTTAGDGVMCPSFQATGDEKDSTRGRSRVLQEMINGNLISEGWRSPEVREALEYCLACKGCRRDCPTGVDMAWYKSNVLNEAFSGRIRPINHYSLGWLPRWGRLVTSLRIGWLGNFFLQTPGLKHVIRAVAGVDQRRPLPRFRSGKAARKNRPCANVSAPHGKVAIWVDSFTDAFAGDQLAALLLVLIDAGYDPQVITEPACCGLTWITTGQLDGARKQLTNALDILEPIAAKNIPIVGMEPSCMAVWRSDAPELLPSDNRVDTVASSITTLAELLVATDDWQAPDLSGHEVIAQPHCHHSSVLGWQADAKVLERTGAKVTKLAGCCGLAGNFGVEKGHYEVSVKVAEHDLLPAIKAHPGAVVLSDGFSCRKQVTDLTDSDAVTLAQLLARHS